MAWYWLSDTLTRIMAWHGVSVGTVLAWDTAMRISIFFASVALAGVISGTLHSTSVHIMKKPYFPKAIRGQAYPGYIKVSRAQVERLLNSGQSVRGFMVGNNVNTFHFFGGWHLAHTFEESNLADFQSRCNSFHFYLELELGRRAAFYIRHPYRLRPFTLWTDHRYTRRAAPLEESPFAA
jgi:hypothetical protein